MAEIDYEKLVTTIEKSNEKQTKMMLELIDERYVRKESFNNLKIATVAGFIVLGGGAGILKGIGIL